MRPKENSIHQGDCIKGLAKLPTGSVDLIFADPPFNIGYDYDTYDDSRNRDHYLAWTRQWMSAACDALKANGTVWVAIGDEYAAELKLIATKELALHCRSWVIWYYTFGVNCVRNFSRSHTHLFYLIKDPEDFTFNRDDPEARVPSARQLVYADKRANPRGRLPDNTWILRPQDLEDSFRENEDTWHVPRVCGTFKERAGWHGCQMPEQILARIIRLCSNPGELVVDPFGGSGTTLAVAKKLNRRWIGFELSKEYVRRIRARLSNISPGDPLEGADKPAPESPPVRKPRPKVVQRVVPEAVAPAEQPVSRRPRTNGAGVIQPDAIRSAYLKTCTGLSIDRVLADPQRNEAFLEACRRAGLSGEPAELNQRLVSLRKAGKLGRFNVQRHRLMTRDEMDPFIFASEIAWQLVATRYSLTLDDILCDPRIAAEFDDHARALAPGFSPLQYRWGALWLRKRARKMRDFAEDLPDEFRHLTFRKRALSESGIARLKHETGLYLLATRTSGLYLGLSHHLPQRLARQMESLPELLSRLHVDGIRSDEVRIRLLPLDDDTPESHLLGLQSHLLHQFNPQANYRQAFVA